MTAAVPVGVDFLGQDITVGAEVIYPVRSGSSMWMSRARVEGIVVDERVDANNVVTYSIYLVVRHEDSGVVSRVSRLDRVVVIQDG